LPVFLFKEVMKAVVRDNALSIVLMGLFLSCLLGLSLAGQRQQNNERRSHHLAPLSYGEYVRSSEFLEATMENWESEFLQMFAYVLLTVKLVQRGSAESKSPDEEEAVDRDSRLAATKPDAPWPVRRGGWVLKIYENSLSLALLALFLVSLVLHVVGGTRKHNVEERLHGGQTVRAWQYMGTAQFWSESLQNWQSEFLSVGVLVILTVALRQKGSPQSKPVDSPHRQTGKE